MRPRRESLRDGKRGRERCFVVGRAKARVVKSFCKKNVCVCVYIASVYITSLSSSRPQHSQIPQHRRTIMASGQRQLGIPIGRDAENRALMPEQLVRAFPALQIPQTDRLVVRPR